MKPAWLLIWYAASFVAGRFVVGAVYGALLRGGHLRRNFQGRDIPASVGAGFALMAMLQAPFAALLPEWHFPAAKMMEMLAVCCGFGVLGLLDDLAQSRERGGISGHLKKLGGSGRISTAVMKAFFGLALCFGVRITLGVRGGWISVVVDTLIIALSANAVNLLDVKPGRAIKGFVFAMFLLVGGSLALQHGGGAATVLPGTLVLLVPFALWALASWPYDLGCRAMMGDAGSNVLGAALGLAAVWELSFVSRIVVLSLLVVYHVVCEVGSLSAIIHSVPPLRWADNFGVKLLAPAKAEGFDKENCKD